MDAIQKNLLVYDRMPVDLVIVDHGESEGNLLDSLTETGSVEDAATMPATGSVTSATDGRTPDLESRDLSVLGGRHKSQYRLTQKGRLQSQAAGEFIRRNIGQFDFHFCSEYVRTMESAAYLGLEEAMWTTDFYIREPDFGKFDGFSRPDTPKLLPEGERHNPNFDLLSYQAPGAESISNTCVRVDQFLQKIASHCSGMRVIVLCHPSISFTFRLLLERTLRREYEAEFLQLNSTPHSCNILHYSRKDPHTGVVHAHLKWMRSVNPLIPSAACLWQEIIPPSFTNAALLAIVEKIPQCIDNTPEEIEEFHRAHQIPPRTPNLIPPPSWVEKNTLEYDNMPVDLVIVRHGESEGNLCKKSFLTGNGNSLYSLFASRHTSEYRLTEKGRLQSRAAGRYIKEHLGTFDFYFSSEYIRTLESAYELELPGACWTTDFYVRSGFRDKATRTPQEVDPTGDETLGHSCLRVDQFLQKLTRHCSGMRVIVVCHHGISYTLRLLLERTMRPEFIAAVKNPSNPIGNGHILHYTRRDPVTHMIHRHVNWMRSIDPLTCREPPPWESITRPTWTNEQLWERIGPIKQLVDNDPEEIAAYVAEHPQLANKT
ncbi:phosphoglycerate mutase family protein [Pelomyxa schiedti]|nr:phosphoglycerate mutase family protein [Pelomyxa schiedti]